MRRFFALVFVLCFATIARGGLVVDGFFGDWQTVAPIATDPAADNTDLCDVTEVRAASRGTELFIRFDLGAVVNVQSGPSAGQVPMVHVGFENGDELTIDLRGRRAWLNDPSNTVGLDQTNVTTGPTFAAPMVELRVELGWQGVQVGDTVEISLSGSDEVAPASFTLSDPAIAEPRRSPERMAMTSFRVASLNTRQSGLIDANRRLALARLVNGVRADIYCFQEEWDSSEQEIAALLGQVDPFGDGAAWNIRKVNGCVIASRSNVVAITSFNSRYAAAVVELPEGPVAVLAVHPKCCGFIGSSEDQERIDQTADMIRTLDSLWSGNFGREFTRAPVVVIGDWNLVGSRTPLSMLEHVPNHNLREWPLAHLVQDEVYTWSGAGTGAGSFTPGRLDLVAYSGDRLVRRNGFVLDSRDLNQDELTQHELLQNDSAATDHLMLVADFAFNDALPGDCPGDIDADGQVGMGDLLETLDQLGLGGGRADVTGDGRVDVGDVVFIVYRLGSACG